MRMEVVVNPRARARLLRLVGGTGDAPAAELGERLAAEARAADTKKHQRTRALDQFRIGPLGGLQVGRILGNPQQRQGAFPIAVLELSQRRRYPLEPFLELGLAQAMLANGIRQAPGNRLRERHRGGGEVSAWAHAARPSANSSAREARPVVAAALPTNGGPARRRPGQTRRRQVS